MYIKCEEIELSGEKLPYRIDNFVLEAIQEHFERLETFELKLMGWTKNTDGKVIPNGEPRIECVNRIFPIMVEEGFRCQNKECPYSEAEIIRMIDISHLKMALIVHDEYMRCFETKKKEPKTEKPNPVKRRTTKKSIS